MTIFKSKITSDIVYKADRGVRTTTNKTKVECKNSIIEFLLFNYCYL